MEDIKTQETAAETKQEPSAGAATEKNNEALFKMLDDILEKRSDGIVKNILKTNGVEDDTELKSLLSEYKSNKATKNKAIDDELANLKRENAELSQKIKMGERKSVIAKAASELNISADNMKYVEKLADLSNIEKDGQFDIEAIKTAFQSVIDEIPAFKTETTKTETETGFVKVGGKKTEQTKDELEANRIRKLMGLPELKK